MRAANPYGSGPSQDTLNAPFASRAAPPAGFQFDRDMDDYSGRNDRGFGQRNESYSGSSKKNKGHEDDVDEFDQVDSLSWDYAAEASPHHQSMGQSHVPQTYEPKTSFLDHLKRLKPPSAPLSTLAELNPFGNRRGDSGETRTIYLNDREMNGKGRGGKKGTENEGKRRWKGNEIGTGKYNVVTFLPKFLFGELGVSFSVAGRRWMRLTIFPLVVHLA